MDEFDVIEINKAHQDIAAVLRVYFDALVGEGFTISQALALTIARQRDLTTSPAEPKDDA